MGQEVPFPLEKFMSSKYVVCHLFLWTFTCSGQRGQQVASSFLHSPMSTHCNLFMSTQLSSQRIRVHLLIHQLHSQHFFTRSLILVAYVQEVEVSARQYPRQPTTCSHIYRISSSSSSSVLSSSLYTSKVKCVCEWVFEWQLHCCYMNIYL